MVTASRRAAAIFESTSEKVLTVDCRAYAVRALASALEACSPEMEPAVTTFRRALATLVSTSRRDPCCDVGGALVHHGLEAVVGCHRGQRGVVGRGDGAVHGCHGAVVRQLQVHAVGGAFS